MSQSNKKNTTMSPSLFMGRGDGKERTPKIRAEKTNAPPFGEPGPSNNQLLEAINGLKDEFGARIESLEATISDRVTHNLTSTVQNTVVQEVQRVCEPISQQVNHHQKLLDQLMKSQQRMEIDACKLNAVVTSVPSDTTREQLSDLIKSIESVPLPESTVFRKSKQGKVSSVLKFADVPSRNAYVKAFREANVKIGDSSLRISYEMPFFQKQQNDMLFEKMRAMKALHPGRMYRVDIRNRTITCDGHPVMYQTTTGEILPMSSTMDE